MRTPALTLVSVCLLCLPASAQVDAFPGDYQLTGRYRPVAGSSIQPATTVDLKIERTAGELVVRRKGTRQIVSTTVTYDWVSEPGRLSGNRLVVLFRAPTQSLGLAGSLFGAATPPDNVFQAVYRLDATGNRITEYLFNITRRSPHSGWWSVRTTGARTRTPAAFDALDRRVQRILSTKAMEDAVELHSGSSPRRLLAGEVFGASTRAQAERSLEALFSIRLRASSDPDPVATVLTIVEEPFGWDPSPAWQQDLAPIRELLNAVRQELGAPNQFASTRLLVGRKDMGGYFYDFKCVVMQTHDDRFYAFVLQVEQGTY